MLQINFEALNELMQKENIKNRSQLAKRMKISRSQVTKVFKEQCFPGETFIAKFKDAFPKAKLDNFFYTKSVA